MINGYQEIRVTNWATAATLRRSPLTLANSSSERTPRRYMSRIPEALGPTRRWCLTTRHNASITLSKAQRSPIKNGPVTRYTLPDGTFITGNKRYVTTTKPKKVIHVKARDGRNLYSDVNTSLIVSSTTAKVIFSRLRVGTTRMVITWVSAGPSVTRSLGATLPGTLSLSKSLTDFRLFSFEVHQALSLIKNKDLTS